MASSFLFLMSVIGEKMGTKYWLTTELKKMTWGKPMAHIQIFCIVCYMHISWMYNK